MRQKRTPSQLLISLCFYALGLFALAMGVALSVNAQLGISPVNSIPYVLSFITHISLGTCVTIVFSCYLLLQVFLLRRNFKWINLTQLLFSSLFGYFVDLAQWMLGDFALPTLVGQLVMLALSILCIGLGIGLYVETDLIPMPMEGVTLSVAQLSGKPFPTIKIIVDCLSVVVSILLSFVFLHYLEGIGVGTIATALLAGRAVALFKKPVTAVVGKLCFPQP